jgi:outer membrane protein assembly factor BamB
VIWKVAIPGRGNSSPIVWGDRIFLTTADEDGQHRILLALSREDGSLLWSVDAPAARPEPIFGKNTWASSTPTTDGELVYVWFGNHGLMAVDFGGAIRWHMSFGSVDTRHGTASSPVLYDDRVFLFQDHNGPGGSFVAAVDKATGLEIWRTARETTVGWGSPVVIRAGKRDELIVSSQARVIAYDPDRGRELWRCHGNLSEVTPTPVAGEGLVFTSSGRAGPTLAIRPGGSGNVSRTHVMWKSPKGSPFVPSPLLYGGRLYTINDMASVATAFEARTGRVLFQGRLGRSGREGFSASPVGVDGKVFFTNDDGLTFVLAAGDDFELLHTNDIGERTLASPALVDGRWYIRTIEHLYCIGEA